MKQSAGILLFKVTKDGCRVLLAHPGGPIWGHKDSWTIPKGELDEAEDHLAAAFREFEEEVGITPPVGELIDLGTIKSGSKTNFIWAVEGMMDVSKFSSNTFTMEWPLRSGIIAEFPENDRAAWFDLATAKKKLFNGQVGFIDRLADHLHETTDQSDQPDSPQLTLL
jgi:predicted NUDIX family NTP pyrophosphohydrolase